MKSIMLLRILALSGAMAMAMLTGCATVPYQRVQKLDSANGPKLKPGEAQIERGKPKAFLDKAGWIWPDSLLSKLILWNWKMDRHSISPETEEAIRQYLAYNDMHDVKVRLNDYKPGAEWRRWRNNHSIGPVWKYTLGVLSMVNYTILPGRFFGGDNYNPYSNTMSIYSDVPAVGLHEAGHSKDFSSKKYKGTYSAIYSIPFVNLWHESRATADAIGYLRVQGTTKEEEDAYKILYPAYATYIGGDIGNYISQPYNYVAYAGAVIPGHIIGRIKALNVESRRAGNAHHASPSASKTVTPASPRRSVSSQRRRASTT
jgi:hypothetical protein